MPCYLSDEDIYSVKIICYGIGTADGGGDVTTGDHDDARRDVTVLVNLYNGKSGAPLIMMEGESLSMKRTAAASAVATKYLVNGEPTILTIMGSGRLARSHFQALHALFRFKEVRVWNRSEVSGLKFVNELKCENVNAKWCSEAESAVSNADVICLVTASRTPVLNLTWVQPGAHINAVGACQPTAQEMDPVSMGEAVIYVDSREAANAESGDIILSGVEIYAEIGEVINGTKEAFRQRKTVFKSLGIAVEDAVTAYKVYKNLKNRNKN